ncbi:MAG: DUF2283 domain-containing protein [Chloroflexi bacterium]|nr:DUF2283 domain-containing protein [Chloroflexota bacterium]
MRRLFRRTKPGDASALTITYDPGADAAYLYLAESIGPGGVAFTYGCDPAEVDGMIHLDFDQAGTLVGIEVLGARSKLRPEVLARAVPPGR